MTIETVKDIEAALDNLARLMSEKGISIPFPQIEFKQSRITVWLMAAEDIEGKGAHQFSDRDITQAYSRAVDFIASLSSAEERTTREYLRKVASAVDYAAAEGIDDEYVAPLRGVTCAMTENLLTSEAS